MVPLDCRNLFGGRHYRLLLTLGALAEIEDGLNLASLGDVAARLKTVRAADLAIVAAALLRGAGHDLSPADVLRLPCDLRTLVTVITDAFDAAGLAGDPAHSSSEAVVRGADKVPFAGAT